MREKLHLRTVVCSERQRQPQVAVLKIEMATNKIMLISSRAYVRTYTNVYIYDDDFVFQTRTAGVIFSPDIRPFRDKTKNTTKKKNSRSFYTGVCSITGECIATVFTLTISENGLEIDSRFGPSSITAYYRVTFDILEYPRKIRVAFKSVEEKKNEKFTVKIPRKTSFNSIHSRTEWFERKKYL